MAGRAPDRRKRQREEVRAELVAAAQRLVRGGGYEELTIRKLAAEVGYAPMSVYSYFPDKHAILLALANSAFDLLARRMETHDPVEPLSALSGLIREYIVFGLENPNEYRTVFMSSDMPEASQPEAETFQAGNPALRLLTRAVQRCVDSGVLEGDAGEIARLLWTIAHGAVSLLISFPQHPSGDRETYIDRVVDVALAGIGAQADRGGR
ncbi:MAG: TetR/AcrR family transcriptional regulator [Rhizobiaceae bacterium]|nr:TetR/AcrR family transcriptional regulator [Rhizobiaceae bacterium]